MNQTSHAVLATTWVVAALALALVNFHRGAALAASDEQREEQGEDCAYDAEADLPEEDVTVRDTAPAPAAINPARTVPHVVQHPEPAPPPAAPATVNPDSSAVASFVEAWAQAQTRGDFDAYSAYYAPEFSGVKRVRDGAVTNYTRDRWLRDRAKMFRRGQTVQVTDVAVHVDGDRATATFRQYWKSQNYADQGLKAIDLQRSGSQWRIVREDMKSSAPWDGVLR